MSRVILWPSTYSALGLSRICRMARIMILVPIRFNVVAQSSTSSIAVSSAGTIVR
jgi:hypothetical protein